MDFTFFRIDKSEFSAAGMITCYADYRETIILENLERSLSFNLSRALALGLNPINDLQHRLCARGAQFEPCPANSPAMI
jgi:hypothetical protein